MKIDIEGVLIEEIKRFPDERGMFNQVIQVTSELKPEFAQLSHSISYENVIRAWHYHLHQTDWWYVPQGVILAVLCDIREDSPTFTNIFEIVMGREHNHVMIKIPPGVAHGFKVLSPPAHLVYITNRTYDPLDEHRIAHDSDFIGYNWFKQVIK